VLGNCVATTVVAKSENDFDLTPATEPATLVANVSS
jgi:hypothetical protein